MSSPFLHPVDLGTLHIDGNLFAAPLAGYTDAVTRALALEGGAALAYTEMISAEALVRGSARTIAMAARADGESILAVQLFGSEPEVLGRAAVLAAGLGADLLDLNAGCPVPKVVNRGAGAALARDGGRLGESVAAMAAAGLPVTVKLRTGWDEGEVSFRRAAASAVEAGAAGIGFHPRYRSQGYGGTADWSLLAEMVTRVPVPVIGSGDLHTPADAMDMFRRTKCAGVMFARGAIGNPTVYHRTATLLETGSEAPRTEKSARLDAALRHVRMARKVFGDDRASREMKKHLAGYVKDWTGAADVRRTLMAASTVEELIERIIEAGGPPSGGTAPGRI